MGASGCWQRLQRSSSGTSSSFFHGVAEVRGPSLGQCARAEVCDGGRGNVLSPLRRLMGDGHVVPPWLAFLGAVLHLV